MVMIWSALKKLLIYSLNPILGIYVADYLFQQAVNLPQYAENGKMNKCKSKQELPLGYCTYYWIKNYNYCGNTMTGSFLLDTLKIISIAYLCSRLLCVRYRYMYIYMNVFWTPSIYSQLVSTWGFTVLLLHLSISHFFIYWTVFSRQGLTA